MSCYYTLDSSDENKQWYCYALKCRITWFNHDYPIMKSTYWQYDTSVIQLVVAESTQKYCKILKSKFSNLQNKYQTWL